MKMTIALVGAFLLMAVSPASAQWNGCWVGASAGIANADMDFGAPVNVGSNGGTLAARAGCDVQMSNIVVGAFADYAFVVGDLRTAGVNTEAVLGGRAGIALPDSKTLAFASAGHSWVDTDGPSGRGWFVGGGLEAKLGGPLSMDVEYRHGWYDFGQPSGVDVTADQIRLGFKVKLGDAPTLFDTAKGK